MSGEVTERRAENRGQESVAGLLAGSTKKAYGVGTERLCGPEETLARVRPYLTSVGITRVANVTGLDRIGIPVYMVIRPNARSLSVSQGKGVDAVAARVSGIMESLEIHHAEYTELATRAERLDELSADVPVVDPLMLPLCRPGVFSAAARVPWVEGYDLIGSGPRWAPFEAVHMNTNAPSPGEGGWFTRTTNGLASGNSLSEAVLHAMCEVVERDAEASWNQRRANALTSTRLDLETVDDAACQQLLGRCAAAGLTVMAWSMPTAVGIPAVRAVLFDRQSDVSLHPVPAARGSGCHPNRSLAFSRALTEAAQGRLTLISGSRDDLTRATYARVQSERVLAFQQRTALGQGSVDFASLPDLRHATIEEDVRHILSKLKSAGLRQAVVIDLSRARWPVKVVKVLVPGLALDQLGARRPAEETPA